MECKIYCVLSYINVGLRWYKTNHTNFTSETLIYNMPKPETISVSLLGYQVYQLWIMSA